MNLNITGKRVFVSGSSRGIGLGIASKFIEEGAKVIINSRDRNELVPIVASHDNYEGVAGDVSDVRSAKSVMSKTAELLGGLDILICNVGSGSSVPPGKETYEEWQRVFDKNFFSATNLISAAENMLESSKGCIVCISSICGVETIPGAPVTYSVAKSALNTYVKSISLPMSKKGIRINCVAPGNIEFEGSSWSRRLSNEPKFVEAMLKNDVPLKKFGSPSDVANMVVWLSSEVANFVTGSVFISDGGQTRG